VVLNKYLIRKQIGVGLYSCINLAEVINTNIKVAVKTVDIGEAAKHKMTLAEVYNEVDMLAKVKSP